MPITARRLHPVPSPRYAGSRLRRLHDPAPPRDGVLDLDFTPTGTDGPAPLPAGLPDADSWLRTVTVAIVEAQTGQRPAHQVDRWLSADVARTVHRRAEVALRRRVQTAAVHVRHIHAQQTLTGAVEAGICLSAGGRIRAAAVRLEPHRSRWIVTAFELA